MKKADIMLILFIAVISLICMGFWSFNKDSNDKKIIEIVYEGKLYKKVLIQDKKYNEKIAVDTKQGHNLVYVHNGGVEIIKANCKDKVCIKTGFIDKKGQIIACLPHKLYIKILDSQNEVDNVSY